jgi:hypothetical protein
MRGRKFISFLLVLPLFTFAECHFLKEECIESGCKTFPIDGTSVTICKPCWKWKKIYVCNDGSYQNGCQQYENNSNYSLVSKQCLVDRYGIGCEVEKRVYAKKVSNLTCGNFAYSECVSRQDFTFSNLVPPYTISNVCTEENRYYYCITETKDYCQPYEGYCSLISGPECTKWDHGVCKLYAHYFKCGNPPSGNCQYLGKVCTDHSTKQIEDESITACWIYTYQYSCLTGKTINNCEVYEKNSNCTLISSHCEDGTCERTYKCLIKQEKNCNEWKTKTYCTNDICNPDSPEYNSLICERNQTDFSKYFGASAYLYMLNEIRKDFACEGDIPQAPQVHYETEIVCSDGVTKCSKGTAYVCKSSPNKNNIATNGRIEYCIQQSGKWVCPYRNEPCVQVSIYQCPQGGYCYEETKEIEGEVNNVSDYPSKPENVGCTDPNYCAETAIGERNVNTPNVAGSCNIRIFPGMGLKCRKPGIQTGFANCCSGGTGNAWGILGDTCNKNEKILAQKRERGLCHYVGEYCSIKIKTPFGKICLQKKKSFCCFNSKLARIIHEQARPQLGISWGSPKHPNCRGFTIEEITKIDWTKIDFSEYIADIKAKTNLSVEGYNLNPHQVLTPAQNLEQYMQDYYENLNSPSNPPTKPEDK